MVYGYNTSFFIVFIKYIRVIYLKSINLSDYNFSMGKLVDIESKDIYNQHHVDGSINIPYETLLYNRERLLNKEETYYIYCQGGHKSKRAVNVLDLYGYNVVQVIINK